MQTISAGKDHSIHRILPANRPATVIVWGTWTVMFLIALVCVIRYGYNLPLAEDWLLVPPLTGNETDYGRFFWEQNNEHRVPLPKFLFLILLKLTHGDFRVGMYVNILFAAILAALFVKTAAKLRNNRIELTDIFFPIILLNLGHWANFFWSWQISFVLPVLFTCLQLNFIAGYKKLLSLPTAILMAICAVLLPLCGGVGLLYLVASWPFLAYEGYLHFQNKENGANQKVGLVLLGGLALSLCLVAVYFIDYETPPSTPPNPGLLPSIKTFFKFIAMGLGPVVSRAWGLFAAIATVILAATGLVLTSVVFKRKGIEFRRAFGLLMFFGGYLGFAVAMGYGRAGWVPTMGMPIRYVLLAVPQFIVSYYVFELYGSALFKKWGKRTLVLVLVLLFVPNIIQTKIWRNWYSASSKGVLRDIKAGVLPSEISKRHQPFLLHWDLKNLHIRMLQLKQAGMGPFKDMKDDPIDKK